MTCRTELRSSHGVAKVCDGPYTVTQKNVLRRVHIRTQTQIRHARPRQMRTNAKKLLVQYLPRKRTSKRSAGYSLAARMGFVTYPIHVARHEDDVEHESDKVYIHISLIANIFFFEKPTPDG